MAGRRHDAGIGRNGERRDREMELRVRVTRKRVALLAAAVAVAATGSIGWAAVGDSGTIQGCVTNNGTIDAIDPVTQACRDRQTAVEWYTKAGADSALLNVGEATSVSGYEIVTKTLNVPSSDMGSGSWPMECPAGKKPLNVILNAYRDLYIFVEPGATWRVYGYHAFQSYGSYPHTVYIVCVNAA
jgi:hypothetical protein